MRYAILSVLVLTLLMAALPVEAEAQSVMVCVIEKTSGMLQPVGMAKTVISGVMTKNGFSVIDTNEYPLTATGEDLQDYFVKKGGTNKFESRSVSASITHMGDIRFDSKYVQSIRGRNLRRIDWRIDADRLNQAASGSGASYILYGEISTKAVPARAMPEGFAGEGYSSAIAVANLRLVNADTKAVVATFVDQAPATQLTKDTAEMNAVKNVATNAGEYFAKQLADLLRPAATPAPTPAATPVPAK